LNLAALSRGVTIQRIFIYRDWPDELDSLARAHQRAGVQVMRVKETELPPALRLNVVVWDESCTLEPEYNSSGSWVKDNYTFAPSEVRLAVERFKLIESLAEPFLQSS